ncbi:MAG: RsmE family RNA methyltransferase [Candidatus Spyradosoma sp.]
MMRAYHPFPVPAEADTLTLSREESFHLVKVLRVRTDEKITAFDGRGNAWTGTPVALDAKALTLAVESRERLAPPACALALAQMLPKGSLADDILRAAVEIGLSEFHPILGARTEMKLDAARAAHKLERWRAVAVEACKQCGNLFVPEIFPVTTAKEFFGKISSSDAGTLKLTASLEADSRGCREIENSLRGNAPRKILWLVGPEGDLSPEEYASARACGFLPARLGRFVLRVPTAAAYCLSVADQMRANLSR